MINLTTSLEGGEINMTLVGDMPPPTESHTESATAYEHKPEPKRYRCLICGTWYDDKREAAECRRADNERFRAWQIREAASRR